VASAAGSAVVEISWAGSCGSLVIEHEEVGVLPSRHVFVDGDASEVSFEGLKTHEEVAVVRAVGVANGSFSGRTDIVPSGVSIGPVANVAFTLPWVSDSDELVAGTRQVGDGLGSNHTVSVTVSNTISVS